jgi:hypothetical protein
LSGRLSVVMAVEASVILAECEIFSSCSTGTS